MCDMYIKMCQLSPNQYEQNIAWIHNYPTYIEAVSSWTVVKLEYPEKTTNISQKNWQPFSHWDMSEWKSNMYV